MENTNPSILPQDLLMPGSQTNPIRERTLANIAILEKKFNERDFSTILPAQRKTLIDQKQQLEDVVKIMKEEKLSVDDKQSKIYQRLVQMVYENKRFDNYVEEYQRKISSNSRMQDKCERELINYKQKNDSARKYVQEISGRNSRFQDDIEKKSFEIDQTRQDHHMLFKVALETIMRRLKDYEADQEKKGVLFEKYGHLDKAMEDEQNKILQLNDQIMEVEKQLYDLQNQFKELIKREYGDLYEQKNHYKQKFEEIKLKSRDFQLAIEDFKRRFAQQNKQMIINKQRQKTLESEGFRVIEQKNYLEKENQELSKQKENLSLIHANLLEEVAQFRKDCQELSEKKRIMEDFIMKNIK